MRAQSVLHLGLGSGRLNALAGVSIAVRTQRPYRVPNTNPSVIRNKFVGVPLWIVT